MLRKVIASDGPILEGILLIVNAKSLLVTDVADKPRYLVEGDREHLSVITPVGFYRYSFSRNIEDRSIVHGERNLE